MLQRTLGVVLTLLGLWPMSAALDAVARRDWLGAGLLLGVLWVVSRSGVELAATAPTDDRQR